MPELTQHYAQEIVPEPSDDAFCYSDDGPIAENYR